MKPRHAPPAFPEALDGDDDDVTWALSTGGVEWSRGAHADALVWLRRAIDAARDGGRPTRARDLEYRGRTLQVALEVGWVQAKPLNSQAPGPVNPTEEEPTETSATDLNPPSEEITLDEDVLEELEELDDLVEFDDVEIVVLSSAPPPPSDAPDTVPQGTSDVSALLPNEETELPSEETTERDFEAGPISRPPDSVPTLGIEGILLSSVPGLQDLPEEAQIQLARKTAIHELGADEEIGGFGLALVLSGSVAVMPTVADVAAAEVERGEPVFSQGHLAEGLTVRVVAGRGGARVASWSPAEYEAAISGCPWVGDELKSIGDRFQTLAGVSMGLLGDNLDDMLRALVIGRCEVRYLLPNEQIAEAGKPISGMYILGVGHLELFQGTEPDVRVESRLSSGDFLFASEILQAAPAPASVRADAGGALVLFAERRVAHELMVSLPPLLEIFAR